MTNAIEIRDLKKHYDNFNLNIHELNIEKGTITGLIGKNGAGKTTLIKAILDIIRKDSGEVKITDKEDIGIVFDNAFFPEIMTPGNISTVMKDIYANWDSEKYKEYLKRFDVKDNQILKTMSKGMRKKVEIATALSHRPKLLILDEPTSGLDPVVRSEVLDLFMDFIQDDDHTIILSTHITSDLEHIADRIVFINDGTITLDESRDELLDNYGLIRCDQEQFKTIDTEDIVTYRMNRYDVEVLTDRKRECSRKYPDLLMEKITIDDLMLMIIKGDR